MSGVQTTTFKGVTYQRSRKDPAVWHPPDNPRDEYDTDELPDLIDALKRTREERAEMTREADRSIAEQEAYLEIIQHLKSRPEYGNGAWYG